MKFLLLIIIISNILNLNYCRNKRILGWPLSSSVNKPKPCGSVSDAFSCSKLRNCIWLGRCMSN